MPKQSLSPLCLCYVFHLHAIALHFFSLPLLCISMPVPRSAMRGHSPTLHHTFQAMPLRRASMLFNAHALLHNAIPTRSLSKPWHRLCQPCDSVAPTSRATRRPCHSDRHFSVAVRRPVRLFETHPKRGISSPPHNVVQRRISATSPCEAGHCFSLPMHSLVLP